MLKIASIVGHNLEIPYDVEYRPAWQPGLVRKSRDVTLAIVRTEDGLTGYACNDGHHARAIERSVAPYLVGQPASATERHARTFRNAGGLWFLDQALWDIIGKAAGMPLYRLWGGYRTTVPAYASTSELGTPSNRAELAARYRDEGFRAMKIRFHNERIEDDLALLDAVKEAAPDLTIMVDANQATNLPSPNLTPSWDYRRALDTARELHARNVLWLEEPLARYDFENLVRLREHTDIYIAGGESNRQLHEFRWLVERGVYDIIQPDCSLSEGISQLRKVAAMAELFKRHFIPHHGLSGLGLAAVLHLVCSINEPLMWLEMMYEPPTRTLETYQQLGGILTTLAWIDKNGNVTVPEAPGLGVEVDESAIAHFAA
ncbi:MAG: mandelate racemase/muconate lactonizing enzyme family protein [Candidatus Eremiobacteraeota bacterium]|nr:mandelate racemase/muconate lactonizing enzyme family protein [Candidatus Eremiobacteraeota bacterium]